MSAETNIATFRTVIEEGFNKGNLNALDDCFSPTYREHQFDLPPTLEGFKGSIHFLRSAFDDFCLTIEDIIAQGDMVWMRMTGRGVNNRPFMGRPPTGKSFEMMVIDICRFEDGKIIDHWGVPDRFHLISQLGFLSGPPEKAPS